MSAVLAASVAAEIRAEMARQQVSQQHIADALGVSRQAVSRRITGEVPWDIAEMSKVAAALGVPVHSYMPAPERVA